MGGEYIYFRSDNFSFIFIRSVIVSFKGTEIFFSWASVTIAPFMASISSLLPAFRS